MTSKELEQIAKGLHSDSLELMGLKNSDYTCNKAEIDALYNFNFIAGVIDDSTFKVWSIYFMKHVLAVVKFCKTGFVESEGIKGRILDLINYAILLYALILQHEQQEKEAADGSR